MKRLALLVAGCVLLGGGAVLADGKVVKPRGYAGSLEELSQEAIIIFQEGDEKRDALEHLILKIGVRGKTDHFAWIVPFPKVPKVEKEDAKLFSELFNYVESRRIDRLPSKGWGGSKDKGDGKPKPVEVVSRETVGSYDVAIVRENEAGALNRWLKDEGFQPLPEDAEDVLGFYRKKEYVFACIKVADTGLSTKDQADLHPLRFTFNTGGRDGIYFPMKMTGLQEEPFSVNLYVFYRYWLNDQLSKYGYVHRGFRLRYRDWDTSQCKPNAGKNWAALEKDYFLLPKAKLIPTVTSLFQKLDPEERFYLTNIYARDLRPSEVREWPEDLWLFPYRKGRDYVPYDVREGRLAEGNWPEVPFDWGHWFVSWGWMIPVGLIAALILFKTWRRRAAQRSATPEVTGNG